jgi:hypothetical protein
MASLDPGFFSSYDKRAALGFADLPYQRGIITSSAIATSQLRKGALA